MADTTPLPAPVTALGVIHPLDAPVLLPVGGATRSRVMQLTEEGQAALQEGVADPDLRQLLQMLSAQSIGDQLGIAVVPMNAAVTQALGDGYARERVSENTEVLTYGLTEMGQDYFDAHSQQEGAFSVTGYTYAEDFTRQRVFIGSIGGILDDSSEVRHNYRIHNLPEQLVEVLRKLLAASPDGLTAWREGDPQRKAMATNVGHTIWRVRMDEQRDMQRLAEAADSYVSLFDERWWWDYTRMGWDGVDAKQLFFETTIEVEGETYHVQLHNLYQSHPLVYVWNADYDKELETLQTLRTWDGARGTFPEDAASSIDRSYTVNLEEDGEVGAAILNVLQTITWLHSDAPTLEERSVPLDEWLSDDRVQPGVNYLLLLNTLKEEGLIEEGLRSIQPTQH